MAGTEDEVRKVIDETLEAQNAGDAARLRSMLSGRPDAVHIGTDPEEWETSNQVVDAVRRMVDPCERAAFNSHVRSIANRAVFEIPDILEDIMERHS